MSDCGSLCAGSLAKSVQGACGGEWPKSLVSLAASRPLSVVSVGRHGPRATPPPGPGEIRLNSGLRRVFIQRRRR